jgi:hypothetical protein
MGALAPFSYLIKKIYQIDNRKNIWKNFERVIFCYQTSNIRRRESHGTALKCSKSYKKAIFLEQLIFCNEIEDFKIPVKKCRAALGNFE